MTETSGKKRRRKTPMEGFNNVPQILAEARRLVDEVSAPEPAAAAPKPLLPPEEAGIRVLHRVPGRIRLRFPRLKWNITLANNLMERLSMVPGISAVEPSTVTGSAVIMYQLREICQPAGQRALRQAWQDLFPGIDPDRLTAIVTG